MSGPKPIDTPQAQFPDLRILPVEQILPHEEHDAQRAEPLIQTIAAAPTWLNPPVVALIDDSNHYVVLDGANRYHAVQALGFRDILVQVVDYKGEYVQLQTWNHAVRQFPAEALLNLIDQIDGIAVQETGMLNAHAGLAAREALAYIVISETQAYILLRQGRRHGLTLSRTAALRAVVNAYKHQGLISRTTDSDYTVVKQFYPDASSVVAFPHYKPAEIMVAARDQDLLPPGITRHIIYGRALRLNYPMDALRDTSLPLAEKNAQLKHWIQQKLAAKQVRFYAEATYNFDE